MKNFSRKIIAGLVLSSALLGFQAQAEIQTSAIGRDVENMPPSGIKKFNGSTACFIAVQSPNVDINNVIPQIFKNSGFNISQDINAPCRIHVTGYLTLPNATSGSTPVDYVFALNNDSKLGNIGPALKIANSSESEAVAKNASGLSSDPVGANGLNVLSQVGGIANGFNGSVAGAALGVVANLFSSIESRQKTPPGLAYIECTVLLEGAFWKSPAFVLGAYAASTTPENPQALIDAGVKRVAKAIWEHTAAYDKANGIPFTMPELSEPGTETKQGEGTSTQKAAGSTAEAGAAQEIQASIKADGAANKTVTDEAAKQ